MADRKRAGRSLCQLRALDGSATCDWIIQNSMEGLSEELYVGVNPAVRLLCTHGIPQMEPNDHTANNISVAVAKLSTGSHYMGHSGSWKSCPGRRGHHVSVQRETVGLVDVSDYISTDSSLSVYSNEGNSGCLFIEG
jgi:hypothetical protein